MGKGKVVASYLVRVTLREPEDHPAAEEPMSAPTNEALERQIKSALEGTGLEAHVTSERTDR